MQAVQGKPKQSGAQQAALLDAATGLNTDAALAIQVDGVLGMRVQRMRRRQHLPTDAQAQRFPQYLAGYAVVGALEIQKAAQEGLLLQACVIGQVLQCKNLVHRGSPGRNPACMGALRLAL